MTKRYWWVSVGGSECEPCVLSDGKIYTFGCPDPFLPDDPGIEMVKEMPEPPLNAAETEAYKEQNRINYEKWRKENPGVRHGYRRFD